MKALALTAAAGVLSALTIVSASALPAAPATQLATPGDTVLVRDGCGRGFRYSARRDRCVPIDRGPVRRRDDDDAARAAAAAAAAAILFGITRHHNNNTRHHNNNRNSPGQHKKKH